MFHFSYDSFPDRFAKIFSAVCSGGTGQKSASSHFRCGRQNSSMWPWRKRRKRLRYGIGAGKTLDAQQGVRGFVCPKPVSVSQAAVSGHHRDHEGRKSLDRWDSVGAGAWRQPADPSGKPDPLEEGDDTDQTAEGHDGFRGGSEPDWDWGRWDYKNFTSFGEGGGGLR